MKHPVDRLFIYFVISFAFWCCNRDANEISSSESVWSKMESVKTSYEYDVGGRNLSSYIMRQDGMPIAVWVETNSKSYISLKAKMKLNEDQWSEEVVIDENEDGKYLSSPRLINLENDTNSIILWKKSGIKKKILQYALLNDRSVTTPKLVYDSGEISDFGIEKSSSNRIYAISLLGSGITLSEFKEDKWVSKEIYQSDTISFFKVQIDKISDANFAILLSSLSCQRGGDVCGGPDYYIFEYDLNTGIKSLTNIGAKDFSPGSYSDDFPFITQGGITNIFFPRGDGVEWIRKPLGGELTKNLIPKKSDIDKFSGDGGVGIIHARVTEKGIFLSLDSDENFEREMIIYSASELEEIVDLQIQTPSRDYTVVTFISSKPNDYTLRSIVIANGTHSLNEFFSDSSPRRIMTNSTLTSSSIMCEYYYGGTARVYYDDKTHSLQYSSVVLTR